MQDLPILIDSFGEYFAFFGGPHSKNMNFMILMP